MNEARLLKGRYLLIPLWAAIALAAVVTEFDNRASAAEQNRPTREVRLSADRVTAWTEGRLRFQLAEGQCILEQGGFQLRSDACLVWSEVGETTAVKPVGVAATGRVQTVTGGRPSETASEFQTVLESDQPIVIRTDNRQDVSGVDHPLYSKALKLLGADDLVQGIPTTDATRTGDGDEPVEVIPAATGVKAPDDPQEVISVQFLQPPPENQSPLGMPIVADPEAGGAKEIQSSTSASPLASPVIPDAGTGRRRIRVTKRSSQPFQQEWFQTDDGQRMFVFTGGVRVIVEELDTGNVVSVVADRAVIWTRGDIPGQISGAGGEAEGEQPIEIYLEGNVFVRQGNIRSVQKSNTVVLSGKQVYVNVNSNQALVLDGSVETYDDQLRMPLLMNAAEIRQLTPEEFFASSAAFTSSPYRGTPGYEFAARQVYFEEIQQPVNNPFTGRQVVDSQTGEPMVRTRHFATGYSNILRVSDIPVFYWPYIRADVQDPLGPLEDFQIGNTNNLGFSTSVVLDTWQLLGLDYLPFADQSNWLLDLGYHSKRGPAGGSRLNYFGADLFGVPGQYYGNVLTWGIIDSGEDFLGVNRQGIAPPREGRGRFRFQHHQQLPNDMTLIAEFSHLSDSNLLESFFEAEYDTAKDQETLLYLKQARDFWGWTALVKPRVNSFLPQNQWLPRLDGYLLGVPLLENRLTYFQRSSLGYGTLTPPNQYVLPMDQRLDLGRFDTRHEIDLPLEVGPWNVTPYVVGQFTGYTDSPEEDALARLYGAGGVRTSLPFWKVYPSVESRLLNLSGIAHKSTVNLDYLYARSTHSFEELPFMDQLDDDTSELVRRQNVLRQFGGVAPFRYDPRFIALRRNLTYFPEALDDMHNVRLGFQQKLQTKRGPIGGQRIVDWMTLDIGATYFPEADRDNLGESFGILDSMYEWHVGDRTSIRSTVLHEPLDGTLSATSAIYSQRPPRNTVALFYSHFASGPFESNYIGFSSSYRFSRKYAGSIITGADLETPQNMSYELNFTRVGLDFLVTAGIVYNAGRDDFGIRFSILPRVQARSTFNRAIMRTLPFGVEPSESPTPITEDRLSIMNNTFMTN